MIGSHALAPLPVVIPLLGAAVLAALRRWLNRELADSIGLAIAAATLFISSLLLRIAMMGSFVYWFGNWHPRGSMVVGIAFVVEPIGAGLAVLAAFLTLLALLFSWRFVDSGGNHLQPLMLIFLAAMSGFVLTGDLFNLFVFFELMSTAAFALCGLKTAEPSPLQGAFNFAVTNTVAAFLVLTGIALLYSVTGALNMGQIGLALGARHDPLVLFAFTIITCGFLTKAAIVPFHLWLPDAHAVAPTPVCVLFSGIMVELGLYAVVRLRYVVFAHTFDTHESALRSILLAFGAATVVIGGLMCYAEHHLKRMLAFSTISHAGLMLVAFAIQGPLAVAAMFTYLLAHALVKSGLFFVSGIILHRLRSISEKVLFGRGVGLYRTAALWFLGGAGLAAAPAFATSLGEAGASKAADQVGLHGVSLLFLFGGVMTCAAVWRVGIHTFLGWGSSPLSDRSADVGELPETAVEDRQIRWYHYAPATLCILGAILLTFTPGWLQVLCNAADTLVSQQAYLHTVYVGANTLMEQSLWTEALRGAAFRGAVGLVLAAALASTSVCRLKLPRSARLGSIIESGLGPLKVIQSGHPGDYVAWLTAGLASFGLVVQILLR
jgi:multicomponent Na+:H+ antiporter subunit D